MMNSKLSSANDWENKVTYFVSDANEGIITKDDVMNAAKKVAEFKNDPSIIETTKSRLGLK